MYVILPDMRDCFNSLDDLDVERTAAQKLSRKWRNHGVDDSKK